MKKDADLNNGCFNTDKNGIIQTPNVEFTFGINLPPKKKNEMIKLQSMSPRCCVTDGTFDFEFVFQSSLLGASLNWFKLVLVSSQYIQMIFSDPVQIVLILDQPSVSVSKVCFSFSLI